MTQADRRFALLDLISLITACAIAFAVCVFRRRQWDEYGANWTAVNTISLSWHFAGYWLLVLTAYLGAMTLRRKPSRQTIVASRGTACVLSICLVALIAIPANWNVFFGSALSLYALPVILPFSIVSDPLVAACAAISTWMALNIASVPTSKADWLDRAGKIISCIWLLYALAQPILYADVLRALGVPMR